MRAHLHGGVPVAEIDHLARYFGNYDGVKALLFQGREERYHDFADAVESKDRIKALIESAPGVQTKHAEFHQALDAWWAENVSEIELLPHTQNAFKLRRYCIDSLAQALVPLRILDLHQVQGAVAGYMKSLESDFKSVAASGWGPELVPEVDILHSQFPEVLAQIEQDQARIAELEGLFAAASDSEDEEGDAEEVDTESGVLPKSLVKALKDERKTLRGDVRELKKRVKEMRQDADRMERAGGLFDNSNELRTEASDTEAEAVDKAERIEDIDRQLARHTELETELKQLKATIRDVERKKDEMIAAARAKISEDEARELILERFQRLLTEQFDGYLRQYQRGFIAAIENLWDKYAVTAKQLLAERDREAEQLDRFLVELGYE